MRVVEIETQVHAEDGQENHKHKDDSDTVTAGAQQDHGTKQVVRRRGGGNECSQTADIDKCEF